jgi:hypothetical protein
MEVTNKFKSPAMRQGSEGVEVRECSAKCVMNSKSEFHQPPIIRVIALTGNLQEDQPGAEEAGLATGRQETLRGRGRGRGRPGRGDNRRRAGRPGRR